MNKKIAKYLHLAFILFINFNGINIDCLQNQCISNTKYNLFKENFYINNKDESIKKNFIINMSNINL